MCNGDGTGHLLDEHHAVGSAVLRRKSGYFDKTDELQKRLPHSRIFRERDISPILPVRPGYVELPVAPIAPSLARSHVSRALASWGLARLDDTVRLVASELVTNAIKASGWTPPGDDAAAPAAAVPQAHGTIWIGVYRSLYDVVVEVWDPSREPRILTPDFDDDHGRGLWLVSQAVRRWGYRRPVTGGKWVWAAIAAD